MGSDIQLIRCNMIQVADADPQDRYVEVAPGRDVDLSANTTRG